MSTHATLFLERLGDVSDAIVHNFRHSTDVLAGAVWHVTVHVHIVLWSLQGPVHILRIDVSFSV